MWTILAAARRPVQHQHSRAHGFGPADWPPPARVRAAGQHL